MNSKHNTANVKEKKALHDESVRRIAFVSDAVLPYHNGGKERRLYELAKRLVSDSCEVHVYTMKWWDGPRVVQHEGVQYHALCKQYPMYTRGRRSMYEAIMFGFATLKLLFEKFDVVDVDHMPYFPLFSARIVTWIKGKKMYATWHEVCGREKWNEYLGGVVGWVAHLVEQLSFRMPDVILSNSKHTTARLRHAGVRKTIETIPLGVDTEYLRSVYPDGNESDVIFVGRLLHHKHIDTLVKAIAIVKTRYPNIVCNIIGNGPEKITLQTLIGNLELQKNVSIFDSVKAGEQYKFMKASKMLVLPSVQEGFGLVVLEANALGLPAITTSHTNNAAKDLIVEGVNGFLTETDETALADKIVQVLDSRHAMNPERDVAQYDWKFVVRNLKHALV